MGSIRPSQSSTNPPSIHPALPTLCIITLAVSDKPQLLKSVYLSFEASMQDWSNTSLVVDWERHVWCRSDALVFVYIAKSSVFVILVSDSCMNMLSMLCCQECGTHDKARASQKRWGTFEVAREPAVYTMSLQVHTAYKRTVRIPIECKSTWHRSRWSGRYLIVDRVSSSGWVLKTLRAWVAGRVRGGVSW